MNLAAMPCDVVSGRHAVRCGVRCSWRLWRQRLKDVFDAMAGSTLVDFGWWEDGLAKRAELKATFESFDADGSGDVRANAENTPE